MLPPSYIYHKKQNKAKKLLKEPQHCFNQKIKQVAKEARHHIYFDI